MTRRIDRRHFLHGAAGLLSVALTGCASDMKRKCEARMDDLECVNDELHLEKSPLVYRIGARDTPSVMLLHELPGLTWCDIDAARRLSTNGFAVYLPLMFGSLGQESVARGYLQSCFGSEFVCGKLAARSPIQDWLAEVFQAISREYKQPIGAVGMCLTGSFPLALLGAGAQAAVLCQPTVPFTTVLGKPFGDEKFDLGVSDADLECALKSNVPIIAMRFKRDPKCPPERLAALEGRFGARVAMATLNEQGHSTLAGDCNPDAFADTVDYLRVRLGLEPGPKPMRVACLAGRPCEISAEGWRAT
jgi:dienelactone hydrolase